MSTDFYWAHSKNGLGQRQSMEDHLYAVAGDASVFARPFGGSELAHFLGLWHDVGKYHADFQEYLRQAEENPGSVRRGPDHKAAGAQIAKEHKLEPLMLPLQGHHGGLHDRFEMMDWFKAKQDRTAGAIAIARQRVPELLPAAQLRFPAYVRSTSPLSLEFFLRM